MDRRRRRSSRSASRSRPRHRSPDHGPRRRSRSFSSRSPSHSVVRRQSPFPRAKKGHARERHFSRSASREREPPWELQRARKMSQEGGRSTSRRSRSVDGHVPSRSRDVSQWEVSHRRRSSNLSDHSCSPRGGHVRHDVKTPHHRTTPRRQSPGRRKQRRSSSCRRYSPSLRQRSASPRRPSDSLRGRSGSRPHSPHPRRQSQHQRTSSPRHRSTSVRRRSRSRSRDHQSRSRSDSRRRQSQAAASRSSSSRGRSSDCNMDRQFTDPLAAKPSPAVLPSSAAGTSPKATSADCTGDKQNWKESTKVDRVSDDHRTSTAGSHEHRGGNIHDAAYGPNRHQVHNHRPFQQDACAPSFSTATQGSSTPAKSNSTLDRVTTSLLRGSASTPTRSTGVNGNHPTISFVVNPIVEKMRQAQRESHRAYLKSNSDYNRAEMKYVSIEAELRLAEFWLEIMTKNLEDVGKRIEVHDWNFQKIIGQDEGNVA